MSDKMKVCGNCTNSKPYDPPRYINDIGIWKCKITGKDVSCMKGAYDCLDYIHKK